MKIVSAHAVGSQLQLHTDCGHVGIAPASPSVTERALELAEHVLFGADPRAVVANWSALQDWIGFDADAQRRQAAALLDIAAWDLKAKYDNSPLWRAVGGSQPSAVACLVADERTKWPAFRALLEKYEFSAAMLSLEALGATDSRQSSELLSDFPDRVDLLLQVSRSADRKEVTERILDLEKARDIAAVELSYTRWGNADCRTLSHSIAAGVCVTEAPASAASLFRELDHVAIDMITIDCGLSGVTGSLQIADAAYGYELPVLLEPGPEGIGVHLTSAIPTAAYLKVPSVFLAGETPLGVFVVNQGRASCRQGLGLGINAVGSVGGQT